MTTEARLREERIYPPSPAFLDANVTAEAYARAAADPPAFWEDAARRLDWAEPWTAVHEWDPPVDGAAPAARWLSSLSSSSAYIGSRGTSLSL